ncbi:hypothetical protein [Oleiharenicola lentus]|uniref:hypothetical protein n=1 Tax=Oleiharenicola lentus TaxID=2508720 RepID=UPI003F665ED8
MRTKLAALISVIATVVIVAVLRAQTHSAEAIDTTPNSHGRGWEEPTAHDRELLSAHGSLIKKVYLNLRGLRRLIVDYHNNVPGSAPPPNGRLVRAPGKGVHAQRYAEAHGDATEEQELVNFPRQIDNSTLPCFPPIFNQGELNSCTSVATTYYQLTHMTGLARGWDQKRATPEMRFSPQWTFNLINNGNNLGAFQVRAYTALMAHGAASLKEVPYRGSPTPTLNIRQWPTDANIWKGALEHRIESFGTVQEKNIVMFLRRIKLLLVNGHVLTAATAIDAWNKEFIVDNPGSRLDASHVGEFIATVVGLKSGNHCITIVGYNDDLWVDLNGDGEVNPGEKGALKIANSWGVGDWNRGFRWLHYSALYGPRDEEEAQDRQPGLYANQVFWITPARDYVPAVVMQVDLPPTYRNEFSLKAGVTTKEAAASVGFAPNFAFNYNGGRYGFEGRNNPDTVRAVLDLTDQARRSGPKAADITLKIDRQDNSSVVPRARLIETNTGTVHELTFTNTGAGNAYTAQAPLLRFMDKPDLKMTVPPQVDVAHKGKIKIPIDVKGGTEKDKVNVKVFSCTSSILATNDMQVEQDANGQSFLSITPPPSSDGGSCVLSVQADDGVKAVNSNIRLNLLAADETAPTLSAGKPQRDNLNVRVPFTLHPVKGVVEEMLVFFDISNLDQVGSYKITGTGAERVLTIQLRYWSPFELTLSALDGGLVAASHVKVES